MEYVTDSDVTTFKQTEILSYIVTLDGLVAATRS